MHRPEVLIMRDCETNQVTLEFRGMPFSSFGTFS